MLYTAATYPSWLYSTVVQKDLQWEIRTGGGCLESGNLMVSYMVEGFSLLRHPLWEVLLWGLGVHPPSMFTSWRPITRGRLLAQGISTACYNNNAYSQNESPIPACSFECRTHKSGQGSPVCQCCRMSWSSLKPSRPDKVSCNWQWEAPSTGRTWLPKRWDLSSEQAEVSVCVCVVWCCVVWLALTKCEGRSLTTPDPQDHTIQTPENICWSLFYVITSFKFTR